MTNLGDAARRVCGVPCEVETVSGDDGIEAGGRGVGYDRAGRCRLPRKGDTRVPGAGNVGDGVRQGRGGAGGRASRAQRRKVRVEERQRVGVVVACGLLDAAGPDLRLGVRGSAGGEHRIGAQLARRRDDRSRIHQPGYERVATRRGDDAVQPALRVGCRDEVGAGRDDRHCHGKVDGRRFVIREGLPDKERARHPQPTRDLLGGAGHGNRDTARSQAVAALQEPQIRCGQRKRGNHASAGGIVTAWVRSDDPIASRGLACCHSVTCAAVCRMIRDRLSMAVPVNFLPVGLSMRADTVMSDPGVATAGVTELMVTGNSSPLDASAWAGGAHSKAAAATRIPTIVARYVSGRWDR